MDDHAKFVRCALDTLKYLSELKESGGTDDHSLLEEIMELTQMCDDILSDIKLFHVEPNA